MTVPPRRLRQLVRYSLPGTSEYSRLGHAWLSRMGPYSEEIGWSHRGRRALLAALIGSQFRAHSPTHTLNGALGLPPRRSHQASQGQVH
jgi:hypothetical protein